jgi:hypothetical protein
MPSPQFNKEKSQNRWYTITYQSNGLLTEELHHQVKSKIAKILVDAFPIVEIHSYIHGSVVFSLNTNSPLLKFDEIVVALTVPLAKHSPKLHFELALVARLDNGINYMYIDGIDSMDVNFLESIKDFWPKKAR